MQLYRQREPWMRQKRSQTHPLGETLHQEGFSLDFPGLDIPGMSAEDSQTFPARAEDIFQLKERF